MKKILAYLSLAALVLTGCAGSRSDDPEALDNALVGFMETPTGLCCVYNMKLLPDSVKNCKYMRRDLLLDPYEKIPFDRQALKKKLEAAKAKKAKKKAKRKR